MQKAPFFPSARKLQAYSLASWLAPNAMSLISDIAYALFVNAFMLHILSHLFYFVNTFFGKFYYKYLIFFI